MENNEMLVDHTPVMKIVILGLAAFVAIIVLSTVIHFGSDKPILTPAHSYNCQQNGISCPAGYHRNPLVVNPPQKN